MANTKSLEETLAKVKRLRENLSAEVVVQEQEGHEEDTYGPHNSYGIFYIIDKYRITNPDNQKRESAKQQLQQIFESHKYYSARFSAGQALYSGEWKNEISFRGKSNVEERWAGLLGQKRDLWKNELERELSTTDLEKKESIETDILGFEIGTFSEKLIKQIYSEGVHKDLRKKAGIHLRYSPLRIWAHENPVGATVGGIAATAAASGLGYMIYQYMNR